MNKKYIIFFGFFFIMNLIKIEARVLMNPSISDWLWYAGSIEYPLDFYFYNKRLGFCWDIGVNYINRYADLALTCQSIDLGKNLSLLFHGSDNFILNDFQPVSNNISQSDGSVYEFLPSYVLNETSCQLNIQVSKDFFYCNEKYIHATMRCIVPFSKQSVVNIASGNMYYNTSANNIKHKDYRKNMYKNNIIKNNKQNKDIILKKNHYPVKLDDNNKVTIISPYIQLKQVDGNDLFAIKGSYFNESNQSLFNYIANKVASPYVVLNKNFAPGYLLDKNYNFLSLDDIAHSYSLLSDVNSDISYAQLISTEGNGIVIDSLNQRYTVLNTSYSLDGMVPGSALIPIYTYGPSDIFVEKTFYVNDNLGISYPIVTEPNYISDVNIGNIVSSAEVVFGDGFTGDINTVNLSPNTVLKVISTGPYGNNNPMLNPIWNRQQVEFEVPPVVVQYNENEFPADFGIKVDVEKLKQSYNTKNNGSQFDFYGDFLKNSSNNNNPRVTILNTDGTFYDNSANCALLWYQNDYSGLFNNPSNPEIINNLNNIYITSSLDYQFNKPTKASQIIYDKIESNPSPDCCQKVVNWVAGCVYSPIVKNLNTNLGILQSQIWSLVNVGNNVVGNQSPIAQDATATLSQDPLCQDWQNYTTTDEIIDLRSLDIERMSAKVFTNNSNFSNGKYGSMQYNGFNQSGLGNIIFECLLGSYFFNNAALLDLYIALECPTADNTNEDSSYLALGIGNGGHYVGRVGFQGCIDFDSVFRFRMSGKVYLEHGFSGFEKLVPQLDGFPIFGIIPVKMDTNVDWNGGLCYIDGSLYANDFSGVTLSYQYWSKLKDSISMISPVELMIPNTEDIDNNGNIIPNTNQQLGVNFNDVMVMSKRKSHTFGMSIFSKLMDECFINCGASRVVSGENIPQLLDLFLSIGINY